MVRKFPSFRSERKKRTTSDGTPQFPNGISGKLPYYLTSNRKFRIFWPNGKHPWLLANHSFKFLSVPVCQPSRMILYELHSVNLNLNWGRFYNFSWQILLRRFGFLSWYCSWFQPKLLGLSLCCSNCLLCPGLCHPPSYFMPLNRVQVKRVCGTRH